MKKDVFHFCRRGASSQPKHPKITDNTIATLSPVLLIVPEKVSYTIGCGLIF
ncbi:hypothetical protein CLU79DRAFT_734116 [Phycomyces nitens]|nr:hypothetical protein CLU79DRAFT_734116 [Phycomyces nitens]